MWQHPLVGKKLRTPHIYSYLKASGSAWTIARDLKYLGNVWQIGKAAWKTSALVFIINPKGVMIMEKIIKIHLEKLPEGFYLATSDDIQGLIAQGRTVTETIEIARDVAKKLIEEQRFPAVNLGAISDSFEYPLIVGT